MGGKYELRIEEGEEVRDIFTNSWFEFMKLRLTKNVVYYKVIVE